jgi:hypothetical protein
MKKQFKLIVLVVAILNLSVAAKAAGWTGEPRIPATVNAQASYQIEDGYGQYTGYGKTKLQAAGQAREACIMQKVIAYEGRHGVTPDEDTADLFIDACINR